MAIREWGAWNVSAASSVAKTHLVVVDDLSKFTPEFTR